MSVAAEIGVKHCEVKREPQRTPGAIGPHLRVGTLCDSAARSWRGGLAWRKNKLKRWTKIQLWFVTNSQWEF